MSDPYAALLELTEREQSLVLAGAWEDLAAVDMSRRALLARLPGGAQPSHARATLQRALEVQTATTALIGAQVGELRRSLGHVSRGRVAVRGYGGGAPGARTGGRVDLSG
ncbi:MAG: hypothetical protein QOE11_371 [Solirubrobacteraceae bacterium]|jgi:hypothetical protein|nr:hypothetical protein [Solirubrobacteraceae bacterium]